MWSTLPTIHYRAPQVAYLMIGVWAIALLYWWLTCKREQALRVFYGPILVHTLSQRRPIILVVLKTLLLCLTWMLATLALMQPYVSTGLSATPADSANATTPAREKRKRPHEVIFLIDASASMAIADSRGGETRLHTAKDIVDEVLSRFHGESTAVYAFTSTLLSIVPVTWDYLLVRLMARDLQINESDSAGTDFLATLQELRNKLWANAQPDKSLTVVLLSDGGDTLYQAAQGADKGDRLRQILTLIADRPNIQFLTVGIGSEAGGEVPDVSYEGQPVHSQLDTNLLRALSNGRGRLLLANSLSSYDIARELGALIAQQAAFEERAMLTQNTTTQTIHTRALFQLPLLLALLTLVLAILVPEKEKRRARTPR